MKKCFRLLLPILILLNLARGSCSKTGAPADTGSPSPAPAPSPTAASSGDGTVEPGPLRTRYISGILDAVTERTVTLALTDGSLRMFGRGADTVVNKEDALVSGSLVVIEYEVPPDESEGGGPAAVVRLTVVATPDEVLRMRAQRLLDTLTLEEKVGQLFLTHFPAGDAPGKTLALQPGEIGRASCRERFPGELAGGRPGGRSRLSG
jgi:hypothetical protein